MPVSLWIINDDNCSKLPFPPRNWQSSLASLSTSVTQEPAMLSWECSMATRESCRWGGLDPWGMARGGLKIQGVY